MFRRVLVASCTAPCAASSQLFGDCDISSITLTTLAMVIILLLLLIAGGAALARFSVQCLSLDSSCLSVWTSLAGDAGLLRRPRFRLTRRQTRAYNEARLVRRVTVFRQ